MAKKFYYQGKNKQSGNKPPQNKQNNALEVKATPAVENNIYPKEKMSLALENIGVGPRTAELLAKNKINTAGDVVMRTERDMFKVQGFNKKMLFELKDALKAQGMELGPTPPSLKRRTSKSLPKRTKSKKSKKHKSLKRTRQSKRRRLTSLKSSQTERTSPSGRLAQSSKGWQVGLLRRLQNSYPCHL
ncbi:MAG: hypothetical protein J6M26_04740 [Clostridia bacterium]|nr:hypothetical protein [Clostridia bacterium]